MKRRVEMKSILITGSAGFIGSNLVLKIIKETNESLTIVAIDNLNNYYDISLKEYRLEQIDKKVLEKKIIYEFYKEDICNKDFIFSLFKKYKFDIVINLAAQAGVRYSIDNPDAYINSNIIGFYNILEACRHFNVKHLLFASSSSVYGSNSKVPYSVADKTDTPVSLYAATKKSNELLAYAYSKLYKIPTTGLRFFTVYGPAGRPDMAYFKFANKLRNNEKIEIYNYGKCFRDFTYIDDIVEGIFRLIDKKPECLSDCNEAPYQLFNIGNCNPVSLLEFVNILQIELVENGVLPKDYDFDAHKVLVPMQPGDVEITYADCKSLEEKIHYKPNTSLKEGIHKFVIWYKEFYKC